jgi:hypothetical protein
MTGIENLESLVKEKLYNEETNAIAASNDIMEYFKEYRHVTPVNSLYQKKDALCNSLLNTICEELKMILVYFHLIQIDIMIHVLLLMK